MTINQSNAIITNPTTKKAIAALKKYAKVEIMLKAAEKEAKEATETIKQAMIDSGVDRVVFDPKLTDGVSGYITLAERTNYKAEDLSEVSDQFKKFSLDTDKVKAQHTLTGELPEGVITTKTQFITKKIKLED